MFTPKTFDASSVASAGDSAASRRFARRKAFAPVSDATRTTSSCTALKPHYYDKYGFNVRISEEAKDGQPFVFSVTLADYTSSDITAFYLD